MVVGVREERETEVEKAWTSVLVFLASCVQGLGLHPKGHRKPLK
jgi:hypothetical protein